MRTPCRKQKLQAGSEPSRKNACDLRDMTTWDKDFQDGPSDRRIQRVIRRRQLKNAAKHFHAKHVHCDGDKNPRLQRIHQHRLEQSGVDLELYPTFEKKLELSKSQVAKPETVTQVGINI